MNDQPQIAALYVDGGVIGRNPSPQGGTWAWCHVDAAGQRIAHGGGIVLPIAWGLAAITNNLTELLALAEGLESLPAGWRGTVYSDSMVTLGRVFLGWQMNGVPAGLIERVDAAMARIDRRSQWILLDGHPTKAQLAAGIGKRGHRVSEHNVFCDRRCGEIGRMYQAMHEVVS